MDYLNLFFFIALNLVLGLMVGLQQTLIANTILLSPLDKLGLTAMENEPRDWSLRFRLIAATVVWHMGLLGFLVAASADSLDQETGKADQAVVGLSQSLAQLQKTVFRQAETVESTTDIITELKASIDGLDKQLRRQAALVSDSSSSITEIDSNIGSVSAMGQLAQNQQADFLNMDKASAAIVNATQEIEIAVGAQEKMVRNLNSLIEQVSQQSASNTQDLGRLQATIAGFEI